MITCVFYCCFKFLAIGNVKRSNAIDFMLGTGLSTVL